MHKRASRLGLLLLGLLAFSGEASGIQVQLNTAIGEPFPDMRFDALLEGPDYGRLGLDQDEGPFHLREIPGDLLVLEFFNQHCLSCQRQVAHLDSFLKTVEETDLAGRVRVLAVGVGNSAKSLRTFRREFAATYPIAPDRFFERFLELGDPGGTPFTVFLLRRGDQWVLTDFHLGVQGDIELMARTRVMLEGRTHPPVARGDRDSAGDHHPALGLTWAQQEAAARALLSDLAGGEVVLETREAGGKKIFEARSPEGQALGLYARLVSRNPVCDLCHTVHFLFAFDRSGQVRGFQPIYVTKWGNELWSAQDTEKMRGNLLDHKMAELRFDPEVDAVTSATMSSALIFDEIRRTAPLLKALPD